VNLIIAGAKTPTIVRIIDDINKKNTDRQIKLIGFVDNSKELFNQRFMGYNVIGSLSHPMVNKSGVFVVNTIAGSIKDRVETTKQLISNGATFTNIVHPMVNQDYCSFSEGVYIQEGAIIQPNVNIGAHTIVSSLACVAHDSVVGDYVFIGPSVYVCGRVMIEDRCYIGVGARILPNLIVGKGAVISAGSVVTKNVMPQTRVRGIPAEAF